MACAVAPPAALLILEVNARTTTRKVAHIRACPDAAFVIPVPHRLWRDTDMVHIHLANLRRKLGDDAHTPIHPQRPRQGMPNGTRPLS